MRYLGDVNGSVVGGRVTLIYEGALKELEHRVGLMLDPDSSRTCSRKNSNCWVTELVAWALGRWVRSAASLIPGIDAAPLWFTYCLMRCEPFPTPHQAMKASDDPNYKASDAPRKDPQQNEWNQQETPPCYPKYRVATAEHRAKHSRKTDTVASVGMITRIHLCNVSIHVKPRRVA
jgi:hypothetical protein